MILATCYVTLKSGVLDAQGAVVHRALTELGFRDVAGVRMGKYIEVTLDTNDRAAAQQQLRQMGERLLSNSVIEQFRFDLTTMTDGAARSRPSRRSAGPRQPARR